MDWLKDKKNLPIVIGMAVFFLLAAGGLIAFELGAFPSGNAATTTVASSGPPSPPPGASPPAPGAPPPGAPRGPAGTGPVAPGAKPAAASTLINPKNGPDPFNIPGGQKTLTKRAMASNPNGLSGTTAALRDILPKFDLFSLSPQAPPSAPVPNPVSGGVAPANFKVIGTVNSSDGIYAILEVNGQAQTPAKPGDSLSDGTKVISIQPTGVTIRMADGTTATVPLTNGSGPSGGPTPDQSNGPVPYNGPAPFNPGGQPPFNPNGQAPGEQGGVPAYMQ